MINIIIMGLKFCQLYIHCVLVYFNLCLLFSNMQMIKYTESKKRNVNYGYCDINDSIS